MERAWYPLSLVDELVQLTKKFLLCFFRPTLLSHEV